MRFGMRESLIIGGLLLSQPALASTSLDTANNGNGINTRLFMPAIDSKGFFTTNGADVLPAQKYAFGLILDGGFGLLRLSNTDTNVNPSIPRNVNQLIDTQFHGQIFFNYSFITNLVVGVSVPIDMTIGRAQDTGQAPAGTVDGVKTNLSGFLDGSYQVYGKWRFLDPKVNDGLGLAAILLIDLPVSSDVRQGYSADAGPTFTPIVALEKRFGREQRFRVGVNAGLSIVAGSGSYIGDLTASNTGSNLSDGSRARLNLAASYRVFDSLDVIAETYGTYLLNSSGSVGASTSAEVVGGLKIFLDRTSFLFLGGGVRYTDGYQAANERAFLGFVYEPSIGDRDGDGVPDDADQCPDDPGPESNHGCPELDKDSDGDGIPDKDDLCPNEAGPRSNMGCPVQKAVDGDRDHDGVPDSKDKCPDDPGPASNLGCPVTNDRDGDGVPDDVDKCPDEPGPKSHDGCPENKHVILEGSKVMVLDQIQFDYNSANIRADSLPIVDQVADVLKAHPEFTLVEIQGHADERGDENYNLNLTQRRVNSVLAALIARNIPAGRLRAKGYGEYCPVDEGHTEAAWKKNRRVEFKIAKTKDGPTGVDLGCDVAAKHGVKPDPVP